MRLGTVMIHENSEVDGCRLFIVKASHCSRANTFYSRPLITHNLVDSHARFFLYLKTAVSQSINIWARSIQEAHCLADYVTVSLKCQLLYSHFGVKELGSETSLSGRLSGAVVYFSHVPPYQLDGRSFLHLSDGQHKGFGEVGVRAWLVGNIKGLACCWSPSRHSHRQ